ncbi:T9SS type A sorting domain-containing protein [Chryseobacterium sp. CBSDS_008]|uniref:T9SS type A sorting domain-containing protein n=1 Tax=Chryseobacterium sp. CBSDS_008 TaxID=3415265 RepID=UPI003CF22564
MCLDAFTWSKTSTLGISEPTMNDKGNIYPNPTSGVFFMDTLKINGKVSIYDQSGKLVQSAEAVEGENKFDITGLPDGIYLITTESASCKVIKRN